MSFLRRHIVALSAIFAITVVAFVFLPGILTEALRAHLEREIQTAVKQPTRLGSLSVRIRPFGIDLSNLTVGGLDPATGSQPLFRVDTVSVDIPAGALLGGTAQANLVSISGVTLNLLVDGAGHSSLGRLLHQQVKRQATPVTIGELVIRDLHISTYVDRSLMPFAPPPGQADGTVALHVLRARNLVWPFSGEALKQTSWVRTEMEGVVCTAPTAGAVATPVGAIPDGAQVARMTMSVAPGPHIKVRNLEVQGLAAATVYTTAGQPPALPRAMEALFYWVRSLTRDPKQSVDGNKATVESDGILVESFSLRKSRYEVRGPDLIGQNAFWRLIDLTADGTNLVLGPRVTMPASGQLRVVSKSESSSGPGMLLLEMNHLTGAYPRLSFDLHYHVEGIAAPPFTVPLMEEKGPGIMAGQIDATFDGPCRDGALTVDGSLTLSPDFMLDSAMMQLLAGLQKGSPIENVRLRGTLDHPEFVWPSAMEGALGNAMAKILVHGPISGIKTTGDFVGSNLKQGVRGTVKGAQRAGSAFGRFVKGVFDRE